MAFIPVPNVAQIRMEGVVDSQLTINDIYFEISGGGINVVNLQTLVDAVGVWFVDSLTPLLSDDWHASRVVGVDLTSATGVIATGEVSADGGVSGEAEPNNVAACMSIRTANRGRSFRGRNYVPGLPSSLVTLNTLDSTFLANLVTTYNQLKGAGTFSPGWQMVVVSRFSGVNPTTGKPIPRTTGIATPVTSIISVTNKVRSMRSREIGHGA